MTTVRPEREEDVVSAVRSHAHVAPHGRLTKAPLVPGARDAVRLDMTGLSSVTEYDPGEFTFSALAGTPLRDIETLLVRNGQYMPFDPPLAAEGATIGGTLAAGLNGPCRLRYGGLRDFVIGVRFVDGTGALVRGGGRVVKNAAGYDLPKLMVGSAGRLGVLVELTFKVFPVPEATRSLRIRCRDLEDALARTAALVRAPLDVEALELESPAMLVVRIAGAEASLDAHAQRVGAAADRPFDVLAGTDENAYWAGQRAFAWLPAAHWLVKVPVTSRDVPALERALAGLDVVHRYSVAANVAWLAWPADRPLDQLELGALGGVIVRGPDLGDRSPWLGAAARSAGAFAAGVKRALDPDGRMPQLI